MTERSNVEIRSNIPRSPLSCGAIMVVQLWYLAFFALGIAAGHAVVSGFNSGLSR